MLFWIGLVVGLIIGWMIEWIIDWRFWRRTANLDALQFRAELEAARQEIEQLKADYGSATVHGQGDSSASNEPNDNGPNEKDGPRLETNTARLQNIYGTDSSF